MRIKGNPNSIHELIQIMKNENNEELEKHLPYHPKYKTISKVYSPTILNVEVYKISLIPIIIVDINGFGKWSAEVSLLEKFNDHYHKRLRKDPQTFETNLIIETRRLNLEVEIFTEQSVAGFEEYVRLLRGNIETYKIVKKNGFKNTNFSI